MRWNRWIATATVVGAACTMAMISPGAEARRQDGDAGSGGRISEGRVRVAMLTYGAERKSSVCFSDHFLRDVSRETEIRVDPRFSQVDLQSQEMFEFPFAIMTGEGSFELTAEEIENARRFLTSGGFLLASAGCSNAAWNASMKRTLERILPDAELKELPLDHEVFHTIFDIRRLDAKRRGTEAEVFGIEIDGRLRVVYSPEGLNDTQNAGGGCCCCGGNEIRNAGEVNANILAYALTR